MQKWRWEEGRSPLAERARIIEGTLFAMAGQGGAHFPSLPLCSYPSLPHSVLGDRSGGPLLPPTQLVPPV